MSSNEERKGDQEGRRGRGRRGQGPPQRNRQRTEEFEDFKIKLSCSEGNDQTTTGSSGQQRGPGVQGVSGNITAAVSMGPPSSQMTGEIPSYTPVTDVAIGANTLATSGIVGETSGQVPQSSIGSDKEDSSSKANIKASQDVQSERKSAKIHEETLLTPQHPNQPQQKVIKSTSKSHETSNQQEDSTDHHGMRIEGNEGLKEDSQNEDSSIRETHEEEKTAAIPKGSPQDQTINAEDKRSAIKSAEQDSSNIPEDALKTPPSSTSKNEESGAVSREKSGSSPCSYSPLKSQRNLGSQMSSLAMPTPSTGLESKETNLNQKTPKVDAMQESSQVANEANQRLPELQPMSTRRLRGRDQAAEDTTGDDRRIPKASSEEHRREDDEEEKQESDEAA
ncbi:unnamed protein product [Moneuplotes crassus]|uniref:Uncharacterized protein n=1 Tax=Euplotes crassus TaxID=5936 RepID=A0AAD1UN56_EUPCR|nr:unnamed protein product [Moneuplotes crassus]